MIQEIWKCLSTDDVILPALSYALVTHDETVATNAHVLVVHKTDELFSREFIDSIPTDGLLFGRDLLKDLSMKQVDHCEFIPEMNLVVVIHVPKGRTPFKRYFEVKRPADIRPAYPDYNSIWPSDEDKQQTDYIGIKPVLLRKAEAGLGAKKGIKMTIYDPTKPILCESNSKEYPSAKATVMPMMIVNI